MNLALALLHAALTLVSAGTLFFLLLFYCCKRNHGMLEKFSEVI